MNKDMLAPLTGVLFLVVLIIAIVVGGTPPDAKDNVQDIVNHYIDHKDSIEISSLLVVPAGTLLIFFGAYLRKVLSAAEGAGGMLSVLPLVGLAIIATGAAIDSTISFAIAEAADDIDPTAVQAMQAIWDNDFIPLALGTLVFLFSLGLSIIRYGALPKWIGWVAIVLTIAGLTPAGFAAAIGAGLLVLVISVILTLRVRAAAPTTP